jgi:hypothetical protein
MSSSWTAASTEDAGAVEDSLTDVHKAMVKCLSLANTQGYLSFPNGKNPEDSKVASVEAMQWVLLYLSLGHDRCY